MGASVGGGRGGKRRMNADINVVPYIDVMLVLLIIFMITAPLLTQGVDVQLPETEAAPIVLQDEPLTLTIKKDGEVSLNFGEKKNQPLSPEEVVQIAGSMARNKPELMVLVDGDARADYKHIAEALTLLQQAGIKKIGFVTDPISAIPEKTKR